ncbi:MAG: hypothetical protein HY689_04720 [Chloroflexi bacterium]|nr:hypothetical protein [Chloroflexota bacterium]
MRMMLKATMPVEVGNAKIKDGSLATTIQAILAELTPEAAYFIEDQGKRTAILFLDVQDSSQIPALAEPWFLAFNASVEFHVAMNADDLMKAGPAIEQAARSYG